MGVRVKPGEHHFTLRYRIFDNGLVSYKKAQLVVDVPDMKPLHVYGVEASQDGKTLKARSIDLGANDSYGVYLGLKGANEDFYPFSFAR
ncbi:hypothetical protein DYST_01365 [Dyella terrae]|nr:hypothetical protein DYST_01365 [Dyella terrae]